MPAAVILGGHWGDEGKGKIIDLLAERFSYNVRYAGGANAGHTVVNEHGRFSLHQVPSGIFRSGVVPMLGAGVVVDPAALLDELVALRSRGVSVDGFLERFHVSERAHLVMPYHKLLDACAEELRGPDRIGTTGKGIGPAYADKAARDGVRAGDLLDRDRLSDLVRHRVGIANRQLETIHNAPPIEVEHAVAQSREWSDGLGPMVCDVEREVRQALRRSQWVLLEGAQGALLDIDSGSYPYVTSSSTGVAGACASLGIPVSEVAAIVMAVHAYMTRVGEGPFPTELDGEAGYYLRTVGKEFGTTTGRPRRCGWFDAVATRHSLDTNGATSLAVTKLDVLDNLGHIRICVAYEMDGKRIEYLPARADLLARVTPVYEDMPGWKTSTEDACTWGDLPRSAQEYIRRIEELMGVPVSIISVGPARHQTLMLRDPLAA